jgi:hypothetical protein
VFTFKIVSSVSTRDMGVFFLNSTFLKRIPRESLFLIYFLYWFWLLRSLWDNDLGPEGGKAIAEALKVNQTVTNIK